MDESLQSAQDLVSGLFRNNRKQGHVTLHALRSHWVRIAGADLARRTWPIKLERGTLWIGAPDASWAYQLQFVKGELQEAVAAFLQSHLQTEAVTDLRFRAATRPVETLPTEAPAQAVLEVPQAASPCTSQAPTAIPDSALRERFARVRVKQQAHRA